MLRSYAVVLDTSRFGARENMHLMNCEYACAQEAVREGYTTVTV